MKVLSGVKITREIWWVWNGIWGHSVRSDAKLWKVFFLFFLFNFNHCLTVLYQVFLATLELLKAVLKITYKTQFQNCLYEQRVSQFKRWRSTEN